MAWRIWYADGSTYGSDDGPPERAPGYGVQAFAQPDRTPGVGNVGYLVLAGYDWYFWRLDSHEWAGVAGDPAIFDLILHREPITGICAGRAMPRARYHEILAAAQAWAEAQSLPRKSGRAPGEVRQL